MKKKSHDEIIELLNNDEEYYNGIGRLYMSNSNQEMMMRTPELFVKFVNGEYTPASKTHYVFGNALHTLVLEGEEAYKKKFTVLWADVRTTLTDEEKEELKVEKAEEIDLLTDIMNDHKASKAAQIKNLDKKDVQFKLNKASIVEGYDSIFDRIKENKKEITEKYAAIIKEGHVNNEPVATRNNSAYQNSELPRETILLQHEEDDIYILRNKLIAVASEHEDVYNMTATFEGEAEKPYIIEINDVMWKLKVDKIMDFVYDLKTTADISKFLYVAKKYNYDSAAYLYSKATGKPMKFVVIDKETLEVAVIDCDQSFLDSGQLKVEEASEYYKMYIEPALEGDLTLVKTMCEYKTLI